MQKQRIKHLNKTTNTTIYYLQLLCYLSQRWVHARVLVICEMTEYQKMIQMVHFYDEQHERCFDLISKKSGYFLVFVR